MKNSFFSAVIFSCFLTCNGIIIIDATKTPTEQLELTGTETGLRATLVSEFLKKVLAADYMVAINAEQLPVEEEINEEV